MENHMFFESCGSYTTNFTGAHIPSDFTNNALVETVPQLFAGE